MTTFTPVTQGVHHIGLTVSQLEPSADFFVTTLGWQEVRRDPDYPAIFVTDGKTMVTLWSCKEPGPVRAFDRLHNVGLHHVAFQVDSEATLQEVYARVLQDKRVQIEFAPELLRQGPARHMMCTEPSGIRVEFIWPGT